MLANLMTTAQRMGGVGDLYKRVHEAALAEEASFNNRNHVGGGRGISGAVCRAGHVSDPDCLEVHLVVQYYRPANDDEARAVEIDWCLFHNLRNPWITHVHVLTEQPQVRTHTHTRMHARTRRHSRLFARSERVCAFDFFVARFFRNGPLSVSTHSAVTACPCVLAIVQNDQLNTLAHDVPSSRWTQHVIGRRLTFAAAFAFAEAHLPPHRSAAVVANADIMFDGACVFVRAFVRQSFSACSSAADGWMVIVQVDRGFGVLLC